VSASPVDPHLPAVHLRPPRNWINDPNGLVFHDGHYHVFFQYNPHGPEHADVHWGHFRSPDLLHWELLPVALAPTPGGDDADGCYSGNAVSDAGQLTAFYSAHRTDRWWQPVTTAESHDGGYTWTKRKELLIPEPPTGTTMYRDPYVWRQDGRWRMLVGAALDDGRGAALLYESDDLDDWEYLGPFHAGPATHGEATGSGWECPQYAPVGDRGFLIVSDWDAKQGPRSVLVHSGCEEPGGFTASAPVPLGHGPDFYAPALLRAPDGRWLLWGWAWEARDADWVREAGWAGTLTLPREVTLTDDGSVCQQPARELLGLRSERVLHRTGQVTEDQPVELGEVSRTCDLTAVLRSDGSSASGLRLVTSADGAEYLDIRLDPAAGQIVVDRNRASRDPRARGGVYAMPCPAASVAGASVELRIVVDRSVIELYHSTGQALTLRFYPSDDGPWRLQARTSGTGQAGFAVEAWDLHPGGIHEEALTAAGERTA
jgi:beta-fructofuranosidase